MNYTVDIVNSNYKSSLNRNIDLCALHSKLDPSINSKLYYQPQQLVIKDSKGTVLFFVNGKHRVMGCIDELEATFLAYKYVSLIDDVNDFPLVFAQSSTVRVFYNKKIHLLKLAQLLSVTSSSSFLMHYEPEIFPAVLIRKFKPLSVNVFSSGKIMICGVREINQVHNIMDELSNDLDKCEL